MTVNAADTFNPGCAFDQLVRKALMIPLTVVMLDVLGDRPAEMTVAERDHPIEALVFDRAHEPFGIGIRIRRLKRRLDDAWKVRDISIPCAIHSCAGGLDRRARPGSIATNAFDRRFPNSATTFTTTWPSELRALPGTNEDHARRLVASGIGKHAEVLVFG